MHQKTHVNVPYIGNSKDSILAHIIQLEIDIWPSYGNMEIRNRGVRND